jgi:putative polyketide hydroxylase
MSEEPDVVIVGGSLVGLSTALFLRLHGVSCLAVERHTSTAIHPRAGHFQLRAVEILRAAGLEEAVRPSTAPGPRKRPHMKCSQRCRGAI